MKKIFYLACVLVFLMSIVGCGTSGGSNNPGDTTNQDINNVLDSLQTAMKNENIPQVLDCYSDLFRINGNPYTQEAYQTDLETLFQGTDFLTYEFLSRQITITDSTHADVTCVSHTKIIGGAEDNTNYEFTFVKKSYGWVICMVVYVEPTPPPSQNYVFVTQWGYSGSDFGFFSQPVGIAFNNNYNCFYVTDFDNYRVQCFNITGISSLEWGGAGSNNGQFAYLGGIAIDGSNNVYVVDSGNYRIQKFTHDGSYLGKWSGFNYPVDIAIDSTGKVYVTDYQGHCVKKFDANGNLLTQWGSYGTSYGSFKHPIGIAVNASNQVYVVDSDNNRVQKFDSDGNFISAFGSLDAGTGDGQFNTPYRIAIDSSGNIFVTDKNNNRVQKFNASGNFLTKWGSLGSGSNQFNHPDGIAVDASGNIYVVDTGNDRVQKFALAQ